MKKFICLFFLATTISMVVVGCSSNAGSDADVPQVSKEEADAVKDKGAVDKPKVEAAGITEPGK